MKSFVFCILFPNIEINGAVPAHPCLDSLLRDPTNSALLHGALQPQAPILPSKTALQFTTLHAGMVGREGGSRPRAGCGKDTGCAVPHPSQHTAGGGLCIGGACWVRPWPYRWRATSGGQHSTLPRGLGREEECSCLQRRGRRASQSPKCSVGLVWPLSRAAIKPNNLTGCKKGWCDSYTSTWAAYPGLSLGERAFRGGAGWG